MLGLLVQKEMAYLPVQHIHRAFIVSANGNLGAKGSSRILIHSYKLTGSCSFIVGVQQRLIKHGDRASK